jgi:hypothetical protein
MSDIWLLAILIIPILAVILLRVNAVFVYFGLCLGYVLSQFDGGNKYVTKLAKTREVVKLGGTNDIRLILLILPAVVILLFMIKTAHGGKFGPNLLPAIATGILAVLLVVPELPIRTAVNVMNSSMWQDITKYQGALIGTTSLIVLVLFLMQRSKFSHSSKGLKHHKSKG